MFQVLLDTYHVMVLKHRLYTELLCHVQTLCVQSRLVCCRLVFSCLVIHSTFYYQVWLIPSFICCRWNVDLSSFFVPLRNTGKAIGLSLVHLIAFAFVITLSVYFITYQHRLTLSFMLLTKLIHLCTPTSKILTGHATLIQLLTRYLSFLTASHLCGLVQNAVFLF